MSPSSWREQGGSELAVTLRSGTCAGVPRPPGAARRERPQRVSLGGARWRVWAPLLLRAGALALALLGLAGIGVVASRAPGLAVTLAPPAGIGLGALAGQLASLGAGGVRGGVSGGQGPGAYGAATATCGAGPPLDAFAVPLGCSSGEAEPSREATVAGGVRPAGRESAPSAERAESTASAERSGGPCPRGAPLAPARIERASRLVAGGRPSGGAPSASPLAASAPSPAPAPSVAAGTASPPGGPAEGLPGSARVTATPESRVVLNQAGIAELMRLPGVGAKRAAAIVALRERLGRFHHPSDLLRIKGIGPRTLDRILPLLSLD